MFTNGITAFGVHKWNVLKPLPTNQQLFCFFHARKKILQDFVHTVLKEMHWMTSVVHSHLWCHRHFESGAMGVLLHRKFDAGLKSDKVVNLSLDNLTENSQFIEFIQKSKLLKSMKEEKNISLDFRKWPYDIYFLYITRQALFLCCIWFCSCLLFFVTFMQFQINI